MDIANTPRLRLVNPSVDSSREDAMTEAPNETADLESIGARLRTLRTEVEEMISGPGDGAVDLRR